MSDKQQLISGILDAFTRALSGALAETGPEEIRVNWSLTPLPQDDAETWTWWSGGLSTHPGANFFVGAPEETWEKLGRGGSSESNRENASALISRCFAKSVEEYFGNRAAAQDSGPSGAPSADWTRIAIEIRYPAGEWPAAGCVLSPEFEEALGSLEKTQPAAQVPSPASSAGRMKPSDMLMHVQVPVSVSFGSTQIRMKDLLNLDHRIGGGAGPGAARQRGSSGQRSRDRTRRSGGGGRPLRSAGFGIDIGRHPRERNQTLIDRIAILLLIGVLASVLAGVSLKLARRARAGRKRRLRLLEMELRLADASEAFHQEVLRLKHYRVLRPHAIRRNAGFIPSTKVSSLRYIKGRQNED